MKSSNWNAASLAHEITEVIPRPKHFLCCEDCSGSPSHPAADRATACCRREIGVLSNTRRRPSCGADDHVAPCVPTPGAKPAGQSISLGWGKHSAVVEANDDANQACLPGRLAVAFAAHPGAVVSASDAGGSVQPDRLSLRLATPSWNPCMAHLVSALYKPGGPP